MYLIKLFIEAAKLLEMEEVYNNQEVINYSKSLRPEVVSSDGNLFISCPRLHDYILAINLVYAEIATKYIRLTFTRNVPTENGILDPLNLGTILEMIRIVDANGKDVPYTRDDKGMYCFAKDGRINITYHYIPTENENFCFRADHFVGYIPHMTLIYGLCATLCNKYGRYEEQAYYEKKYYQLLPHPLPPKSYMSACKRWV